MRGLIKFLFLVAVAVALTVYHFKTTEQGEERERTERISQRVFPRGEEEDVTLLTEALAEIRITGSESSVETVLERASSEWMITRPRHLSADSAAVSSLARTIAGLRLAGPPSDAVLTDVPHENLSHFGLASPEVRLAVRYEGESAAREIVFGGQDPSRTDRYALDVESGDVMVITDRLTALDKTLFDLRDRRIWQTPTDRSLSAEVRNASGEVIWRVERPTLGDEWRISAPFSDETDSSQVGAIFGQLLGARVTEFTEEDLPRERITEFGAGADRTAALTFETDEGEVARRTLFIGSAVNEDRRIAFAEGDQVLTVDEGSLRNLMGEVNNLQSKTAVLIEPGTIERASHASAALAASFERTASGEISWRAITPIEGVSPEVVSQAVEDFVRSAHSLRGRAVLPPAEATEATEQFLSPPIVTLRLANASEEAILEIGGLTEREGMSGHHFRRAGRHAVLFAEDWRLEDLVLDDLVP